MTQTTSTRRAVVGDTVEVNFYVFPCEEMWMKGTVVEDQRNDGSVRVKFPDGQYMTVPWHRWR